MSKNKFRTLASLLLFLIISNNDWVNVSPEKINGTGDLILTIIDIVMGIMTLVVYIITIIGSVHYGVKAWNEDETKE